MSFWSEGLSTLKAIGWGLLIASLVIGPIIIACVLYDTPERRAKNRVEYHEAYQNSFQACRNFCVEQGAETFAWNGKHGAANECLCGGTLP